MCDYSLYNVKSRPAKVGEKLTTRDFGRGTRGFSALKDRNVAVCLLPGTELSFTNKVRRIRLFVWSKTVSHSKTAIFRKINQDKPVALSRRAGIPEWEARAADVPGRGSARYRSSVTGHDC